jgi:hypothetical protein
MTRGDFILRDQGDELGINVFEIASLRIADLRADRRHRDSGARRALDPTLRDDGIQRHHGDALDVLPDEIVDVVRLFLHFALRIENDRFRAGAGRRVLKAFGDGRGEGITQAGAR